MTNTFDDKVGNFSKNLRMEFRSSIFCLSWVKQFPFHRETKDDMVKKIDEHVQLAIQDSRSVDLSVRLKNIFHSGGLQRTE